MIKIKCKVCKVSFQIDENNISKESKYMQCPECGNITENPLKTED